MLEMDPLDLIGYLQSHYKITIPAAINTTKELEESGKLLSKFSSCYSFFSQLALHAKIIKRKVKAEKAEKNIINDAMSREEIFSTYADLMKQAYSATSRMVTIKMEVNNELKML